MISILLLTTGSDSKKNQIEKIVTNIIKTTNNIKKIELIIKTDNQEQQNEIKESIANPEIDFSILTFLQMRSNEERAVHANYDNLYLNTSYNSEILILIEENDVVFTQDWDLKLLEFYNNAKLKNNHDIFIFTQQNQSPIILSSNFVDYLSGFGHSPNIGSWIKSIQEEYDKNFKNNINISLPFDIIQQKPQNYPEVIDYNSDFVKDIIRLQAISLSNATQKNNIDEEIRSRLQKFSLSDSCKYLNEKFSSFQLISIALTRYAIESTAYILKFHSMEFLDMMTKMVLFKKNVDVELNKEWLLHKDNWNIDGIEPQNSKNNTKTTANPPQAANIQKKEDLIVEVSKDFGLINSIIFLMKRIIMIPIKKVISK